MQMDIQTDRQMDRERHDKHNSQFCSSANASKSDWTVFRTAAIINSQEGRSVMLINIKKEEVMQMATFFFKDVGWRRGRRKPKRTKGGRGNNNISNRKGEQRGK
jgi:hypothetical protein